MLLFEWNALRVGDRVAVHDDTAPDLTLREGTVAIVQTRVGAAADVGIRVDARRSEVLYPRRDAVHIQPLDRRDSCWRCDATAATAMIDPSGRAAA